MTTFNYKITRNYAYQTRMICKGFEEERLTDEDYDATQYRGAFDDFDTYEKEISTNSLDEK